MTESSTSREKKIYSITLWGSLVNFLLLVFKFLAGFLGNSAAMVADAVHSLSDFVTDIIVIAFVRITGMPQDETHDYGHGKFETLATALIGLILLMVGAGIFLNAGGSIVTFLRGESLEAPGLLALAAALVSIVSKEILYRYTVRAGEELHSQAVVANAWHHRSDAFSSIGTLVGIGGAMFLGENWRVLDPLAALVVSLFIVRVAIRLMKPSVDELLERSLPADVEERIRALILSFPEVSSPHHLRTRHIGNTTAIDVHIRMDGTLSLYAAHEITRQIESRLKDEFGPDTLISLHMEPKKETQQ